MGEASAFPAGKRVVFTGRLASMSRLDAIQLVQRRGGIVRQRATEQTNVLVIGADGWPLQKSGMITANLQRAHDLIENGRELEVIGEGEFLRRVTGTASSHLLVGEYTLEKLSRTLGVSGLRIRRWIEQGLVRASSSGECGPVFDFEEVNAARTLSRLIGKGASRAKLVRSLKSLRKWMPENRILGRHLIAMERSLLVRDELDRIIDCNGQLHFSFEDDTESDSTSVANSRLVGEDAARMFDHAYGHEMEGRLKEANAGYAKWLALYGDDRDVLFNLANVLLKQSRLQDARTCYWRCLRCDRRFANGWNNLGLCLIELGERDKAVRALRRAVRLDTNNVDSIYNLADLLDELEWTAEARLWWLRLAKRMDSADVVNYAKKRVHQLRLVAETNKSYIAQKENDTTI